MRSENQNPNRIVHVDMDAFYAAVEVRDNPDLAGKPLIIGALPHERGVVCTCSYEARKFGVRSAMSIKEAYRRCPRGIYMHPNMDKYAAVSREIHQIWTDYTDICETLSLDEGFLDVTDSAGDFGGARAVAHEIKRRTKEVVGLTCSVGVGYSMMAAKLASEENKPDGFFEILTSDELQNLIIDRSVRVIYGVGPKTAERLQRIGISTVRDLYENRMGAEMLLGNYGRQIIELAEGIDRRRVTPYMEPKSIGMEQTFQQDTGNFEYLKAVLSGTAQKLSTDIQEKGVYAQTVTLKVTYADMKSITRSRSGEATDRAADIYEIAAEMLDRIEKRPIRLVGISLGSLTKAPYVQLSLFDTDKTSRQRSVDDAMTQLQLKYG